MIGMSSSFEVLHLPRPWARIRQLTPTHTHTTHTMDTALHTHTGVVPALPTTGRPETAERGETAVAGQLETNGQNDMMVEGGSGGGITSQHHADDGSDQF
jgi:hypothetical protein